MKLSDYQVLTFDVYGTLIDWESGMIAGLKPLTDQLPTNPGRDAILESHARLESTTQKYTPEKNYQEVLALVYKRLAEEWHIPVTWQECQVYGQSVEHWPAFPDSAEALSYLKQFYQLVVLSNVDNVSFSHSNQKLGETFDAVYTAGDIGSYKPAQRNFDYMIEMLAQRGIEKSAILHTAESMFHDHQPANQAGLANCWIYRRHDQQGFGATMNPGDMPSYLFRFDSMADLVAAHRDEVSGRSPD